MITLQVIDHCPSPGGRYITDGDCSGEFFRESILRPRLAEAVGARKRLRVVLDGAPGYSAAFLEEVFGGLVRTCAFKEEDIRLSLLVVSDDPLYQTYRSLALRYLREANERLLSGHTKPSTGQIARFLELFAVLDAFECEQYFIRGHGAFDRATMKLPDPAVISVLAWLKEKAGLGTGRSRLTIDTPNDAGPG